MTDGATIELKQSIGRRSPGLPQRARELLVGEQAGLYCGFVRLGFEPTDLGGIADKLVRIDLLTLRDTMTIHEQLVEGPDVNLGRRGVAVNHPPIQL